ncbi:hypothetical protein HZ326_16557 [Fusarium oxysporum f. sp. albedinis]|nr:hypothetical protein HZ326_16557 [Fusarium oxysporum f. sp. albedinis]
MIITRAITLTNFVVAGSALGFQVFVLYPWHKELDEGFEKLKKEHLRRAIAARFSLVHLLIVIGSFHFVNHAPNPREVISAAKDKILLTKDKLMAAVTKESPTDISLYARYALAGTFCCAFTHAVLTPVDVTSRPCHYNPNQPHDGIDADTSLLLSVKIRIQLDPIAYSSSLSKSACYIVSAEELGALLTGFAYAVDYLGQLTAANNRNAVYLGLAAPSYAAGCVSGLAKLAREEGISGLYSGLGLILLK